MFARRSFVCLAWRMQAPVVETLRPDGSTELTALSGKRGPSRCFPWEFDGVEAVEIVTPDEYSAGLLVEQAMPPFPADVLAGPGWIVRFEVPPSGGKWVVDLLAWSNAG